MRLIRGDCREAMAGFVMDGEQFDAVVTDPPYHLTSTVDRFGKSGSTPAKSNGATGVYARASRGFMGKEWDGGDIAFDPMTWRAAWESLKPGGHLVAFGGSRTYHRIACAIEDAGFELRDSLMWIYGTGFPKSHDNERAIAEHLCEQPGRHYGRALPTKDPRPDDHVCAECAESIEWQGWGSALKPAFEPIILARKPLDGTIAANVLAYGVGGLNIDACRIGFADEADRAGAATGQGTSDSIYGGGKGLRPADMGTQAFTPSPLGRFPANVLHDGSDEVMAAFAAFGESKSGTQRKPLGKGGIWSPSSGAPCGPQHGDSGSAARFFTCCPWSPEELAAASRFYYSGKATAADRAGSKHPTVKPLALMRWLCRLVTPPGGRILDPFAGSGTTLQAGYECGFDVTGCEADPEYQQDIEARIMAVLLA